mmetsp:Transcript_86678/g.248672  ORF Transcript_86678/g.248672 Transcript_86678/m.248672 type:complete len:263 (+) Transcript_86678:2449-3237(+)
MPTVANCKHSARCWGPWCTASPLLAPPVPAPLGDPPQLAPPMSEAGMDSKVTPVDMGNSMGSEMSSSSPQTSSPLPSSSSAPEVGTVPMLLLVAAGAAWAEVDRKPNCLRRLRLESRPSAAGKGSSESKAVARSWASWASPSSTAVDTIAPATPSSTMSRSMTGRFTAANNAAGIKPTPAEMQELMLPPPSQSVLPEWMLQPGAAACHKARDAPPAVPAVRKSLRGRNRLKRPRTIAVASEDGVAKHRPSSRASLPAEAMFP